MELNEIVETTAECLRDGCTADVVTEYALPAKKRFTRPVIAVGMNSGDGISSGLAEYMGEKYDADSDTYSEVYGKRLELGIGISVYSPKDGEYGAEGCLDTVSEVIAALSGLPAGLKIRSFTCGETGFDTDTGMFLCRCELKCVCFLYAERTEESEVLNFTLKGVPKI